MRLNGLCRYAQLLMAGGGAVRVDWDNSGAVSGPLHATFSNVLFTNNTVALSGTVNGTGEVWLGGGAVWVSGGDGVPGGAHVTLEGCTLTANTAALQGGHVIG